MLLARGGDRGVVAASAFRIPVGGTWGGDGGGGGCVGFVHAGAVGCMVVDQTVPVFPGGGAGDPLCIRQRETFSVCHLRHCPAYCL